MTTAFSDAVDTIRSALRAYGLCPGHGKLVEAALRALHEEDARQLAQLARMQARLEIAYRDRSLAWLECSRLRTELQLTRTKAPAPVPASAPGINRAYVGLIEDIYAVFGRGVGMPREKAERLAEAIAHYVDAREEGRK